ncbi:phosphoribosylanthranilate isomerase [Zavarzinia compransoris]|uniref:N-(5'-phosphoribosyl)anthranilate isomerase n=1 Tax=Zavarzinia compransoris TaxID=1264899 RepID=A0A317DUS1_9PROT|nr:phosphoribosylanthranilate isomerase [Zavarzinia compransoris]PWR17730.1 phosphoribosylanthranilate isomerase [Zavarzinia compransoris]
MSGFVKICGLSTAETVDASVARGASHVGFVFYPRSPRNIAPAAAGNLIARLPDHVVPVALTVDADDATIAAILAEAPVKMLQAHGSESPERVADLRRRFGLPVMKAIGIADPADVARAHDYEAVADLLLLDAKAPKKGLPGGNGLAFDWGLIANEGWSRPWFLAGGLTPDTVAEAIRIAGARAVDVSSGVESAPGVKDIGLIAAFLAAARSQFEE